MSLRARVVGACTLAALGLGGVASQPAGAALPARPNVSFVGGYTVRVHWGAAKSSARLHSTTIRPGDFSLSLNADHSASDGLADKIRWKNDGNQITITVHSAHRTAIYLGTKTAKGIGNRAHPGTMSNDTGNSGTWFAVAQNPG